MITYPVVKESLLDAQHDSVLSINEPLVTDWLVSFIRDELVRRRGFSKAVLGLSGGVDSSLVAYLCARALGPENVVGIRMPYQSSSSESLSHAELVAKDLGITMPTIDITAAVDGYLGQAAPEADARRKGNVMARMRMIVLFDQSEKYRALPVGTGNKSERLFGYFTWHADDSPPINPIGDLFKTQVWRLSRYLGVPEVIVSKPASADLVVGQTDEIDFGITYERADRILARLVQGFGVERMVEMGYDADEITIVRKRLDSTHWKRHLPTVAMLSSTSINDYYLRPVDY